MIYVDELRDWGWVLRGKRTKSCHMAADTIVELHAMAKSIGLKLTWFQRVPRPHYDLTPNKRVLAVKAGAEELSSGSFVLTFMKEREENGDL